MERRLVPARGAWVRTYVGDDGWGWLLTRRPGERRIPLDAVDRALCELADGNLTEERLREEAERAILRPLGERELEERLERLVEEGALIDGATGVSDEEGRWPANLTRRRVSAAEAAALAIRVPEGARFGCDGRGACCRLPERIAVTALDVARLKPLWGDEESTPGGLTLESALTAQADGSLTLAARDGACVLLDGDGRCGAHARGGAAAMPAGCRAAPLAAVYCSGGLDGALAFECACEADPPPQAAPLDQAAQALADEARARGAVWEVAEEVSRSTAERIARAPYLRWRDDAIARARGAADPLVWALGEAAQLAGGARDGAWPAIAELCATAADHLGGEARDAAEHAARADLAPRAYAWGSAAAAAAAGLPAPPPAGAATALERQAIEHSLFAHQLLHRRALSTGMAALALGLAIARAAAPPPERCHPLATARFLVRDRLGRALDQAAPRLDQQLKGASEI